MGITLKRKINDLYLWTVTTQHANGHYGTIGTIGHNREEAYRKLMRIIRQGQKNINEGANNEEGPKC